MTWCEAGKFSRLPKPQNCVFVRFFSSKFEGANRCKLENFWKYFCFPGVTGSAPPVQNRRSTLVTAHVPLVDRWRRLEGKAAKGFLVSPAQPPGTENGSYERQEAHLANPSSHNHTGLLKTPSPTWTYQPPLNKITIKYGT